MWIWTTHYLGSLPKKTFAIGESLEMFKRSIPNDFWLFHLDPNPTKGDFPTVTPPAKQPNSEALKAVLEAEEVWSRLQRLKESDQIGFL